MRPSPVFVGLLWYILNTGLPGVSAEERLSSRDTMDAELKRAASSISKAPHPKFRTPRDTWEALLKSVTEGDLLLFGACHAGDEKEERINLDALAPNERARLLEEARQDAKNISLEVIELQYNELSPNQSRLRATMVSTEGKMQITSIDEFELVDTDEGWKISKWTRVAPEVRRHLDDSGKKPPISVPQSSSSRRRETVALQSSSLDTEKSTLAETPSSIPHVSATPSPPTRPQRKSETAPPISNNS